MDKIITKINFDFFLVKFYKQLFLDDLDVVVVLVIKYLLDCGNEIITPEIIAIKMCINEEKIDSILLKLINKKYIAYIKHNNELAITLKPLEDKLVDLFYIEINKKKFLKSDKETIVEIENIINMFQQKLDRKLLEIERSLIKEWVSNGITFEDCLSAVNSVKNINFRELDDLLLKNNTAK